MNIQIRFSEKLPLKGTNFILLFFFFRTLSSRITLLRYFLFYILRLTLFDEFSYILLRKRAILKE